jgi:branched-chain amino acid transport system substrate-binding protein
MNKKAIWIVVIIILIAAILIARPRNSPVPSSSKPIKIGALLILSGEFAKYGEASKNAIEIALADYNKSQNVVAGKFPPVEVVYEDTRGDAKTALSAYQKLVSIDKVDMILGPQLQYEMAALNPVVIKDNIPVFSIAPVPASERGTATNPLVIWPDPTLEADQIAHYVFDQGARKVGILSTEDAWESEVSKAFADKFTELGGSIVADEVVLPDSKDTSLPVTKVMAAKPDSIFIGTYYKFIYFVKKLKELGFSGKLYSIEIDTFLSGETNPFSNGLQFISPAFYTKEFTDTYTKLYGSAPSIPSGQTHDAMALLLQLVQVPGVYSADQQTFRNNILNVMSHVTEFEGVSGRITFSKDHRATFPLSIFEIQNGIINKIK